MAIVLNGVRAVPGRDRLGCAEAEMVQPRLYAKATFLNSHLAAEHTREHVQHIAQVQRFFGAVVFQSGFGVGFQWEETVGLHVHPGVVVVVFVCGFFCVRRKGNRREKKGSKETKKAVETHWKWERNSSNT